MVNVRIQDGSKPHRRFGVRPALTGLCLAGLLLLDDLPAQAGDGLRMSVSPMKLQITAPAGHSTVRTVNVYNNGEAPMRVQTRVVDWTSSPHGEMELAPAEPDRRSAAAFIAPESNEFTVGPHDAGIVRITAALPDSASGSYWAIVFFDCEGGGPSNGLGLVTNVSFGATIYLTAEGTEERDDAIAAMQVNAAGDTSGLSLEFAVRNRGNVYHYPAGWVQVLGSDDATLLEARIPTRVLLPDHELTYKRLWAPPAPGSYRMVVTLDLGLDALVQGVKSFSVPSDLASRPNPPPIPGVAPGSNPRSPIAEVRR